MTDSESKKSWGGVREGSGRKRLSEGGLVKVQIAPQRDELELIDLEAKKAGMNRTRFIVECVRFWTENRKQK